MKREYLKAYSLNDSSEFRRKKRIHEAWKKECKRRAKEQFKKYRDDRKQWQESFNNDSAEMKKQEKIMKKKQELLDKLK